MIKPRLLVITDVFPPEHGGSGRWLWEVYRRLDGFDTTVVTCRPDSAEQQAPALSEPPRVLRPFRKLRSWGVLGPRSMASFVSAAYRVRRIARERGADAIHCGKCLPEGLLALAARWPSRTPVWCFAHGEELTLAETSRELDWLTRFVLSRAAHVIANSRHTRGLLTKRWNVPEHRVTVLTPGVDTRRFCPAPPDAGARARLGWRDRRVILTVGALQPRKGQDMLIRALPAIAARCPDVLYVMVGEGVHRSYLQSLVADLGVARLVQFARAGDDRDLVTMYQQCDLFALPNRQIGWDFEGFGIVLLEAQACGRPVIAGSSGGTAETLLPGLSGELVDAGKPEPLASACVDLLEDPARRDRMGAHGRRHMVERFDWNTLSADAASLFSRVD
jgi:phosphatidylinositol alpha-1,6-mannosyltransferase